MVSGSNDAPQADAPPQPPSDFAATGHHHYPATYLPYFSQPKNPNPYFIPQIFSSSVNTPSLPPAPHGSVPATPVNPFIAPYIYWHPISGPPTYQGQNGVVYGIGSANLSTSPAVAVVGASQSTNAPQKAPKKLKIAQSFSCDICRVDCNNKILLDQHKVGKKHSKNLEKLVTANRSVILPDSDSQQENPVEEDSAQVCTICNIACNSEKVLRFHLAGKKHAKEVKKQAGT